MQIDALNPVKADLIFGSEGKIIANPKKVSSVGLPNLYTFSESPRI